uniref:Uncharacterized protein n=1 Tax=Strigamia maritima TaxID=126957 RepID=T1J920_STRMM
SNSRSKARGTGTSCKLAEKNLTSPCQSWQSWIFTLFTLLINVLSCLTQEAARYPGGCPDMAPSPPFEESKIVGTWVTSYMTNQALKWVHCAKGSVQKESRGLYFDFGLYNSTSLVQSANFTLHTNDNIPGLFNITLDDNLANGYDSIITEDDFFMVWGCCHHDNQHS